MARGDIIILGIVAWLVIRATPYATYLYKEAEIFDDIRGWLLLSDFFADALDCWECSSMHASIITTSIAIAGVAMYFMHPLLSAPFFILLVLLASASWRFDSGLYNSDTDSTE